MTESAGGGTGDASRAIPPNFIEVYDSRTNFQRWAQRFEGALQIYNVKNDDKKNTYFLHYIGSQLYYTLCDLVSPGKPEEKSYKENVKMLVSHLDPEPLEIAEYYKFHHRTQGEGETVKEFVAVLRKMAAGCNFGNGIAKESV